MIDDTPASLEAVRSMKPTGVARDGTRYLVGPDGSRRRRYARPKRGSGKRVRRMWILMRRIERHEA